MGKRSLQSSKRWACGWLVGVALLFGAFPAAAQLDVPEPVRFPGQVVLDTRGIFTLGAADAEALAARTALVQARLNEVLARRSDPPVAAKALGGNWQVLLGDALLVTITAADTAKHNTSARALAQEWAASLRQVLQDKQALAVHREFNSAPEWISYGKFGYVRTGERRTETGGLVSSGYIFKRNAIFLGSREVEPEQVYLREADGSFAVYEKLRSPRSTPPALESTPN
jgi:hypothetical protein